MLVVCVAHYDKFRALFFSDGRNAVNIYVAGLVWNDLQGPGDRSGGIADGQTDAEILKGGVRVHGAQQCLGAPTQLCAQADALKRAQAGCWWPKRIFGARHEAAGDDKGHEAERGDEAQDDEAGEKRIFLVHWS